MASLSHLGPRRWRSLYLSLFRCTIKLRYAARASASAIKTACARLWEYLKRDHRPGKIAWDYWGALVAIAGIAPVVAYGMGEKHIYLGSAVLGLAFIVLGIKVYAAGWSIRAKHVSALFLVVIFIVVCKVWIHSMSVESPDLPIDGPAPDIPKVAIIQGEGFGELHRKAVKYALSPAIQIDYDDCPQRVTEIKLTGEDECAKKLQKWLGERDIVAVIAPSNTETTRPIIKTVANSGYKIPIFVTSAAPRADFKDFNLPIFRISSGIDERAAELATRTRYLVEHGVHVMFLIEQNEGTSVTSYAKKLEIAIGEVEGFEAFMRRHSDSISTVGYEANRAEQSCIEIQRKAKARQVIFHLGLGQDFTTLVSRCSALVKRAAFLGFMNAWAIDKMQAHSDPLVSVYEITDLDVNQPLEDRQSTAMASFLSEYKQLNPAVRDQAFSYDVGTVLLRALDRLQERQRATANLKYSEALGIITNTIQNTDIMGVTGEIRFDKSTRDSHSQNLRTKLSLTRYDFRKHEWVRATWEELARTSF